MFINFVDTTVCVSNYYLLILNNLIGLSGKVYCKVCFGPHVFSCRSLDLCVFQFSIKYYHYSYSSMMHDVIKINILLLI